MKRILIISLLIAGSTAATAQTMMQRKRIMTTPLRFRAVRSKAGGDKKITWQTDYGSQARKNSRTLTYACQASWNGATPTNFTCQAYWIATTPKAGDFVIDITYELPELTPRRTTKWTMTSPEITEDKANYAALGEKTCYGAKLKGVIIRMVDNSETPNKHPLAVYATSSQYKKHGWKSDPAAQFTHNPIGNNLKKYLKNNR